ncbi:phenylacetaldehyde synthase [Arachis hypogaea]|uniref:phenylacetaldehyde synthase n=1 Tax=Arachis hypogaea TaxID=3818 RepID=UPI003B20D539
MHDITVNCFSLVPSPVLAVLFLYPLTSKGKILPRVTHWQSPNYFVLDWLAKALKLPHDFHSTGQGGGVIQGTTSEAVIVVLLAARIGGLNPELCRSLKTDVSTNYALSPEVFSEAVSRDIASGLIPFFLCAIVGTTSLTAIDPLPEMRKIELVDCAFLSGFINVVSELIESNHSGCSRGVSTEELIHINTSIVLEALGAAPVPGATTLTEKLNHQGFSFKGTRNHCISFR